MRRKFRYFVVFFLFAAFAGKSVFAQNYLLKIDFSQKTTPVQAGFQGYFAEHEVENTFVPQSFQIGENRVIIKAEWPAGTPNTAMQMIDRGANSNQEMNDVLRDWIGTDGRVAKAPLILTISGLPEGEYEWSSIHHDLNDQTGLFNVTVEDAIQKNNFKGIDISSGKIPFANVTVFKTAIHSNGGDIRFSFEMNSNTENSESFFVMNGFSIAIPDTIIKPEQTQLIAPLDGMKNVLLNPVLKWEKIALADLYNVYFDTENPPDFFESTKNNTIQLSALNPETTYYWQIETGNKNGKVKSEIRSFTTKGNDSNVFPDELKVEFSHSRKFYNEGFYLKITSNNAEANIIYTLNSSVPGNENGKVYHEEIFIDSTTVVKAVAISNSDTSELITHTFLFTETIASQGKSPPGFPEFWGGSSIIGADYEMDAEILNHSEYSAEISKAMLSVPAVSLTMNVDDWFNPATGVYVGYPNSNISREKAVTAEFIFPETGEHFSVECGVQNQGGTSIIDWKVPKQSMRLLFKEMYGPGKLRYKLFPDSEIKSINTLVLDAMLYSWVHPWDDEQRITSLYFRDQLASDMQNKMGWYSFHGIYVNLFINGLYWGLYDLHERPDDAFLAEYLDSDRDDFEIIKHNPNNVVQGTNHFYLEMLEMARRGIKTPQDLKNFSKYLDIPAFIDYIILNFYLGNFDWAHQNYYAARNRSANTGFRFYTWDAEHVMRYSDVTYNNTQKNDKGGPTEIHTLLKQNEEYRVMFADAVYRHFFNDGVLTPDSFENAFLYRKNEIEDAIILESARWGDYRKDISGVTYTKNDHWVPEVNKVLQDYIPRRRDIVINQLRANNPKQFPDNMPPVVLIETQSGSKKQVELKNMNIADGDIYYTLDGTDPRGTGGVVQGLKYAGPVIVEKSTIVKARFLPKQFANWSALAEKPVLFEGIYGGDLVISEIMYHPGEGFPEFLELLNTGENIIVLEGSSFIKGIEFTFPAGSAVLPGAGLILTSDTAAFKNVYGFSAFGQYNKRLDNNGELLILNNKFNQIIDSVRYSDTIPWPPETRGYSLELVDSKQDNSLHHNWKLSDKKNGTPFQPESEMESDIILYPNPFSDLLHIRFANKELAFEVFEIEIFDLLGNLVRRLEMSSYNSKIEFPVSDLSRGIYLIHIRPKQKTKEKSYCIKAVKL